ncbi:stealth conserved region 3 domain-containing protein [Streptomyces chartreusis]|uniref:stealth conserved region 3 domain-containing protein n=1 Tax=Streptomyces chartreusis TaxID=1969 RepID=UPI00382332F6
MTTNNFMHAPLPQQREMLETLERLLPEHIGRTTASYSRSSSDIIMTAPLLYEYALMTGRSVPSKYSFRYVNINRPNAARRLAGLRHIRGYDFFCLNDVDTLLQERERGNARMHEFLEDYVPFPSLLERPGPSSHPAEKQN